MAGLQATLYQYSRTAERLPVERPSTLRSEDGKPIDATIEDLSITGCRLTLPTDASIGDDVMIGLAGVGIRSAMVIWSDANQVGCAFDKPLTMAEFQTVQFAQTVAEGRFPAPPSQPSHDLAYTQSTSKLPPAARLAIIFGLATASWALIGGIAAAGYFIFAG